MAAILGKSAQKVLRAGFPGPAQATHSLSMCHTAWTACISPDRHHFVSFSPPAAVQPRRSFLELSFQADTNPDRVSDAEVVWQELRSLPVAS
jgi:hypothetical protein